MPTLNILANDLTSFRYVFLARAENSDGLSHPSPVSERVRTLRLMSSDFNDLERNGQPIDLADVQNTLLSKVVELSSVEAISSTGKYFISSTDRKMMQINICFSYYLSQPVKIDLNKKSLPKQKTIQNFTIDAQGFRKTKNENPPTWEMGVTS